MAERLHLALTIPDYIGYCTTMWNVVFAVTCAGQIAGWLDLVRIC